MGVMNTNFWVDELKDESETGLMKPEDIVDIIIFNTQEQANMNISKIIIKNHFDFNNLGLRYNIN